MKFATVYGTDLISPFSKITERRLPKSDEVSLAAGEEANMRGTDVAGPHRFQFSVVNSSGQELGLGKFVIFGVVQIGAVVCFKQQPVAPRRLSGSLLVPRGILAPRRGTLR